ncbi:MAG: hypothetical protein U0J70_10205 [Atopobiaceae bacterium]|nr:hypothetical protein [Atopobiaceae bacterium]
MRHSLRNPFAMAALYFAIFFVVMLSYGYYQAAFVTHTPFEFDLFKNLGLPVFTAIVGYVTAKFGKR